MGCGGWFQGMVTWGGQNMATIPGCQLWSWHIPRVWAATVMTPPHRVFVWPVLQLLWIPEPIEWEGFTSLRDHHNKQTGPQNKFPSHQCPNNCQWWQFAWFWFNTKRFFMKHLQISRFHLSQPSSGVGAINIENKQKQMLKSRNNVLLYPNIASHV